MEKAHKGLGVDIWLRNVIHYSFEVWNTEYAKKEMTKEDHEALYKIHIQAKKLHEKYVENENI